MGSIEIHGMILQKTQIDKDDARKNTIGQNVKQKLIIKTAI